MAAVDTPPGLGLPGAPVGYFHARPGPRRLATRGLIYCVVVGVPALALHARGRSPEQLVGPLNVVATAIAVCVVTFAVRRARVGIASDGVRWGWGGVVVRVAAEQIALVRLYRDAIALTRPRGSTWFLARRDWDRFELMRRTVLAAGLPCEELDRDAPWRARLQSYGRFVDGLVVVSVVAVTVVALQALG